MLGALTFMCHPNFGGNSWQQAIMHGSEHIMQARDDQDRTDSLLVPLPGTWSLAAHQPAVCVTSCSITAVSIPVLQYHSTHSACEKLLLKLACVCQAAAVAEGAGSQRAAGTRAAAEAAAGSCCPQGPVSSRSGAPGAGTAAGPADCCTDCRCLQLSGLDCSPF